MQPDPVVMDAVSAPMALADWRRRIGALYQTVRTATDAEAAWRQWRATRDELFKTHPQTPLDGAARDRFTALPYFDYDPALRFTVPLGPPAESAEIELPLRDDGAVALRPFARTRGLTADLGAELTLYWLSGYGGGIFLPFKDATAGRETFGGGRYLLDTIKGADLGEVNGWVLLDFNFAYNPSCAYSDAWHCPLAPAANRLPAAVRGGERSST